MGGKQDASSPVTISRNADSVLAILRESAETRAAKRIKIMKAISLWQPWASAIALGYKTIETRGWSTHYRGPIAIHAAKRNTPEERDMAQAFERLGLAGLVGAPLGSIVAVARLSGVRPTEHLIEEISETEEMLGNYGPRRFGWMLKDIRKLDDPIPYRGMQGLFEIPDDILNT